MPTYNKIFENNREWARERKKADPHFFEVLTGGQNPDYMYIGCSDSRVTAEEIMGLQPGDVFVHRNVGNLVVPDDLNTMSAIKYAVSYLKVKHIIVCGHYFCGGIQAAMDDVSYGSLDPWLANIRSIHDDHLPELCVFNDNESRNRKMVEINVREQCRHVLLAECVKESVKTTGLPKVHGWVFDIQSGLLSDLELRFD